MAKTISKEVEERIYAELKEIENKCEDNEIMKQDIKENIDNIIKLIWGE